MTVTVILAAITRLRTGGSHDRSVRLRRHPHPARARQEHRIPARHQADLAGRRAARGAAQAQPRPGPVPRRGRHARLRLPGRRAGRRHRPHRRAGRRLRDRRPGLPAQPVLRVRPRGRQHRRPEGALGLGGPARRRRRRVDVARADGLGRRPVGDGPGDRLRHQLRPAGRQRRPDRDDGGLQPHRRRHLRRRVAGPRRQGDRQRQLRPLGHPGRRHQRPDRARARTSSPAPARPSSRWPASSRPSPRSARWAASTRSRCRSTTGSRRSTTSTRPGNSSGIVDGAALDADRQRAGRPRPRPDRRGPASCRSASSAPSRRSC